MKTISRIIIILLAATLVGAVTYALGNSSWATAQVDFGGRGGERFEREGRAVAAAETAGQPLRAEGRGLRPEHRHGGSEGFGREGGRGFSLFGLFGLARTIVPIALIIGVVVLASNGLGRLFNRRKRKTIPASAAAPVVDVTPSAVTSSAVMPTDITPTDVTPPDTASTTDEQSASAPM